MSSSSSSSSGKTRKKSSKTSSSSSKKFSTAEEAIYQSSRSDMEKLLLHLSKEGIVKDQTLEDFLSPLGIKSKRQKISAKNLQVTNPRGKHNTFPIGSFSKLPISVTLNCILGLDFTERIDFTSLVSKGFRSDSMRDQSLWKSFHVNLCLTGSSVDGTTRKLNTFVKKNDVVKTLSIRTQKGGIVAREVIKILVLPKFSNITKLSLSGKRITPAVLKKLTSLKMCSSTLEEFTLRDANGIKPEDIINVCVKGQRNLRKLSVDLNHDIVAGILNKSTLRDNKSAITHLDCNSRYSFDTLRLPTIHLFATRFLDLMSLKMTVGRSISESTIELPLFPQLRDLNLDLATSEWGGGLGPPEAPSSKYLVNHSESTLANIEQLTRALDTRYSLFVGKFLRSCPKLEMATFRIIKGYLSGKDQKKGSRMVPLEFSSSGIFEDGMHSNGNGGKSSKNYSSSSSSSSSSNSSSSGNSSRPFPTNLTSLKLSGVAKLLPNEKSFHDGLASQTKNGKFVATFAAYQF